MHSLHSRLVIGILFGITALLGTAGTITYLNIRERLYEDFDRNLVQRTVLLASMIEDEAGTIKIEWLEHEDHPPAHSPGIEYFSVWKKESGELLAASPEIGAESIPRFGGSFAAPELREIVLPEGRPGRCAGIEFDARIGLRNEEDSAGEPSNGTPSDRGAESPIVQCVIAQADTVAPTLQAIRRPLIGLWASCTVLGAFMIGWIVRKSLRPLGQLKAQIGRLEEGVSGQRIALLNQPAELEPVVDELNSLLERVEKALVRERTLTSNVAHELRTPIAGLLSTLEVTLNRLRSPAEYRESTQECFEIAKRMHWLVNNLLSITRIEAGNLQLRHQLVSIENALTEWWNPFAARADERNLRVEWMIQPDASIKTDPEFLRVVVTNLFDNALSYTPEGGTIRIEANSQGVVSIANQTIDLDAKTVERVFDPFWRFTDSREGAAAHAGLGLSLCKKIIELLGGRIQARVHESKGLFIVQLDMA